MKNPFRSLTKFEWCLWTGSVVAVTAAFLIYSTDYLTLIASVIGVTALIFVSKGMVFGQILCVIFAVFYGIVSYFFRYYGEVITYLCMSGPIALMSVVSWIKHPFEKSEEVEVNRLTNYTITCAPIRTGRIITDFEFYIVNVEKTPLIRSSYTKKEQIVDEAYALFKKKCGMLPEAPTDDKTKSLIVRAYNAGVDFNTLFESVSFFVKKLPIPYSYWEYMSFEWVLKNAARIYGLVCDNLTEKDINKIKRAVTELLNKEVRRVEQKAKRVEQKQ